MDLILNLIVYSFVISASLMVIGMVFDFPVLNGIWSAIEHPIEKSYRNFERKIKPRFYAANSKIETFFRKG